MRKLLRCLPVLVLGLFGCEDSPTTKFPPGKGPPDSAGPVTVKTITKGITFKPEVPEEPRTDELGRQLIGTYFDTTFGLFQASAYFNFNLPINGNFSDSFLNQRQIDSAVLKMATGNGGFGDQGTIQQVNFYRIDQTIQESETFGPNASIDVLSDPIGRLTDSLVPNQTFRVKLDQDFVTFFKDASVAQLTNNQNFINFFQGVAAIPQDQFSQNREGGIAYLGLLGSARIVFYQPNGRKDSILVDQRSARFNTYKYNREEAFVEVGQPSSQYGFLQPPSGLKTTLNFQTNEAEGIRQLLDDGKVNIHKANIIFPVSPTYHKRDAPPPVMEVWAEDNGDRALTDTTQFNKNRQQYRIDKPRYVQEILTAIADDRPPRYGALNFRVPFDPPRSNPALLIGANNPDAEGVRVEVTFSKVN